MPCDRPEAIARLIALWCCRQCDDPEFHLRVTLRDFLDSDVISAVERGNLLVEFASDAIERRVAELHQELARRQRLLLAWKSDVRQAALQ